MSTRWSTCRRLVVVHDLENADKLLLVGTDIGSCHIADEHNFAGKRFFKEKYLNIPDIDAFVGCHVSGSLFDEEIEGGHIETGEQRHPVVLQPKTYLSYSKLQCVRTAENPLGMHSSTVNALDYESEQPGFEPCRDLSGSQRGSEAGNY